jgi:hypothetical protein
MSSDRDLYAAVLGLRRRAPGRPSPLPDRAPPRGPVRGREPGILLRTDAPPTANPTSPTRKEGPMGPFTIPPLPARAAAGAALLDRHRPSWARQVDPAQLDMEDCRVDVLGQLYGWFGTGTAALAPGLGEAEADAWTVAYGLDLDDTDLRPSDAFVDPFRVLTDAWRAEVLRRRDGDVG